MIVPNFGQKVCDFRFVRITLQYSYFLSTNKMSTCILSTGCYTFNCFNNIKSPPTIIFKQRSMFDPYDPALHKGGKHKANSGVEGDQYTKHCCYQCISHSSVAISCWCIVNLPPQTIWGGSELISHCLF